MFFEDIKDNQKIHQLIFIGSLGSCLGKTIFETWFSDWDYFKVYAVAGPGVLRGSVSSGEGIKIPLILQSTQGDSDLNLSLSNVPVPSTYSVLGTSSVSAGLSNPVKGSVEDMSSSGFWKIPFKTFNEEISPLV